MDKKPRTSWIGFYCLNVTQFFGAANDNILKQVLVFGIAANGIWAGQLGEGAQAYGSLCLAVPFVLLSGFAGQFSDRYNKRAVCIVVKVWEILIALLAFWGLWIADLWIVLASMILISVQSTFFSPAKYGMLPEILPAERLSRANGTINMFTYVAVIFGAAIGGALYDAYAPVDESSVPKRWLPGAILVLVALLGTVGSLGIPRLSSHNPKLRIRPHLFRAYVETWREIASTPLASVIVAWSYFYLIVAGVAILILPDYKSLLGISATMTSMLMVLLGIAIGVGDYVAGLVSGERIRPELIPIGAVGTTGAFFLLGVIPLDFEAIAVCLVAAGFLAGFFMVPLQTMTQRLSTIEQRGRVLGLWNCGSFVGIILGNFLFLAVKSFGVRSNHVFFLCAGLGLTVILLYYFRWKPIFESALAERESGQDGSPLRSRDAQ